MLGKYKLKVKKANEPDFINWMNLGVSDELRIVFAILNFFLTIAILISVLILILWLKNLEDEITKQIPIYATDKVLSQENAQEDYTKN